MLGYFPAPYPDELLYSICARYTDCINYPNKREICSELFGSRNTTVVVDFPGFIQHLADILPPNNCYSSEQIIENHTLFPFYQPFLSIERATEIKSQLKSTKATGVHLRLGISASRVKSVNFLRFCPLCVKKDVEKFGETYWHRIHQVESVKACPFHCVYLEETAIKIHCPSHQHHFFSANSVIPKNTRIRQLGNSRNEAHILKLAQLSDELLRLKRPAIDKQSWRAKYLNLLIKRGYASFSSSLRANKLETEFLDFYGQEFLSEFDCQLTKTGNQTKGNWLLNLLRKYPAGCQHPLHHLLLLNFLDTNLKDFFNLSEDVDFFGKAPWRCLNKAASHYKQFVVTDFRLGSRYRNGKPVGIFKCNCGFEFARSGPDTNPEDKFRIDKIINFGEVWKNELIKLWNSPTLKLSEISRRLGVEPLTVKRYAHDIGLSFERRLKNYQTLNDSNQLKISSENSIKTEENKAQWLKLLKQFPDISLKELRQQNSQLYSWLFMHETEWLKANLPQKPKREKISNTSVNWKERDKELAELIQKTAKQLVENQTRPKRITKTAIGKEANCLSLLQVKLYRLPQTDKALEKVVETNEGFAIRRIRWAAAYLNDNHIPVTYWNLVEKACVFKLKHIPLIRQALNKEICVY
jgi:hypothetical protein